MNHATANLKALYSYGLAFLTGREASQKRLLQKLLTRGQPEEAKMVLDRLIQEGWVSDRRFAECYIHSRSEKGFGPRAIEYALRQEGLSEALIQDVLSEMKINWEEILEKLIHRKFPAIPNSSSPNRSKSDKSMLLRAKAERFLISRGFDWESIRKALTSVLFVG
jgi:regulatory protein